MLGNDSDLAITKYSLTARESLDDEVTDNNATDKSEKPSAKEARGHIETKYIPRGHKKHGPYLYLRYWQGGKLRSKYLGKPRRS